MKPLREIDPWKPWETWKIVVVMAAIGLILPWVLLIMDTFIVRHLRAWGLL